MNQKRIGVTPPRRVRLTGRLLFFAADVDILDLRQFLKWANIQQVGGALGEA